MIPKYLSLIWAAVAPAVANHLWQSTLFAVIAGLLTLTLRKNQARARYWLWLAASVKFLVPFSLLIDIGGYLARPSGAAGMQGGFYVAVQEVATVSDFLTVGLSQKPTVNLTAADRGYHLIHLLPATLVVVWLCGLMAVLFVWCARWRRMSRACRAAVPLREGREVESLRRMERMAGIRKPIQLLLSRSSLEPGIFGIFHSVLVWPKGISECLDDGQLEAILAHELWHVRRRDNLAALLHMVVEAIFWFHPLVWWMGGRMVEERERACDEQVLQMGNPPQVYAESILKACEFCVAAPLSCVSGVTGSDLKKRIVRIMTQRGARKLGVRTKLLLVVAGFLAVALPVGFGLAHGRPGQANAAKSAALSEASNATETAAPKFEVASIKPAPPGSHMFRLGTTPGRFSANGVPAKMLIEFAYNLKSDGQLVGAPGWVNSQRFNIDAKEDDAFVQKMRKLSFDEGGAQVRLMVQSLLADRFKLRVSRETSERPVYALIVAKNG
ncbi:MAG: TIGR03435 family protein, partial [Terriglobia bacterium]